MARSEEMEAYLLTKRKERDDAFLDEVQRLNAAIKAGAKIRVPPLKGAPNQTAYLIRSVIWEEDGTTYGLEEGRRAYWYDTHVGPFTCMDNARWQEVLAQAGIEQHPLLAEKREWFEQFWNRKGSNKGEQEREQV